MTMPRIRKEATARRNEILDAAQRLIYAKGYEPMTIQDILDELRISKGGFFHHFGSKQALLEALVERMHEEAEPFLLSIVDDAQRPALEKLRRLLVEGTQWKTERRSLMLPLIRVWYGDENVLTRRKMHAAGSRTTLPVLETLISQGIQEGVFDTPYPDHAASAIYSLWRAQDETVAQLLLAPGSSEEKLPQLLTMIAAYVDITERILGAPSGSLQLVGPEMVEQWLAD
jgi:AcrR family transcriptional regulator